MIFTWLKISTNPLILFVKYQSREKIRVKSRGKNLATHLSLGTLTKNCQTAMQVLGEKATKLLIRILPSAEQSPLVWQVQSSGCVDGTSAIGSKRI